MRRNDATAAPRRPPPRRSVPRPPPRPSLHAPATPPASDWAAAASFDPADPDYAAFLDTLTTRFARAALASDDRALAPGSDWHCDVADLGQAAAEAGAMQAARFAWCLLKCAAHRWPDEAGDVEAPYEAALLKIHGLLQDSGWRLLRPGDEASAAGADDEAWQI